MSSLASTYIRWVCTVRREMYCRSPICGLVSPVGDQAGDGLLGRGQAGPAEPRPIAPAAAQPGRAQCPGPGAAVSAAALIIGLALIIVDIKAAARGRFLGHSLSASQLRPLIITVWVVVGLVVIALWLWMARADSQGRNWARIVSTVLFGLAALQLRGDFTQPVSHAGSGVTVLYYGGTALFAAAWLAGAAAVWLLWRPASSAFFRSQGFTRALPRQV